MQLIDVPFSLSAEYPNRYNPDSLAPSGAETFALQGGDEWYF